MNKHVANACDIRKYVIDASMYKMRISDKQCNKCITIVTSCIYFHCFIAIQFCSAGVFTKPCKRGFVLPFIRSFDISRMFAAPRYDVVR